MRTRASAWRWTRHSFAGRRVTWVLDEIIAAGGLAAVDPLRQRSADDEPSLPGLVNEHRPHNILDYRTPNEFAAKDRGFINGGTGQKAANADPLPHTSIPARNEDGIQMECRIFKRAE